MDGHDILPEPMRRHSAEVTDDDDSVGRSD
jgi:hypothetical protein